MNSVFVNNNNSIVKLIIIWLIILSSSSYSQIAVFDSLVNKGINEIYNIKFNEAQNTFTELNQKYPDHPAGKFFEAMIIWWKIMLDNSNEEFDELFEEKLEEVIDFCDDILDEDDSNVDAIFFKGGALGFRGRLYSIRKEWFDAALDGKDALPLVYEAYEIDPTNEDVKLGFGIYNYYAEAIPEKYPFIKPAMIFFPSGDKEKGIAQLKAAADKSKYAGVESQFFLLNLYYQFENEYDKALEYARQLHSKYPDNPIFHKYLGRIFVKKGNYRVASEYFSEIQKKCNNELPGYNKVLLREASYYLGVNSMNSNLIDSAKTCFLNCERLSKELDADSDEESGFQVNSVLYLGKICGQKGNTELAKRYYERVLEMRDYNKSHDKAERYLNKIYKKKAGD